MDQTLISQASEAVDSVSRNSLRLPVEDCLEATRDRHQHLEVVVSARSFFDNEIVLTKVGGFGASAQPASTFGAARPTFGATGGSTFGGGAQQSELHFRHVSAQSVLRIQTLAESSVTPHQLLALPTTNNLLADYSAPSHPHHHLSVQAQLPVSLALNPPRHLHSVAVEPLQILRTPMQSSSTLAIVRLHHHLVPVPSTRPTTRHGSKIQAQRAHHLIFHLTYSTQSAPWKPTVALARTS